MIRAYYGTRRGSGVRTLATADDAERMLSSSYYRTVRLLDDAGNVVGERWRDDDCWRWFFDPDAFR